MFKEDAEVVHGREWTLTHAFFANMGGFLLETPDYKDGFPINGEQLYYLIKHKFVEFPVIEKSEIDDRSRVDGLSKSVL